MSVTRIMDEITQQQPHTAAPLERGKSRNTTAWVSGVLLVALVCFGGYVLIEPMLHSASEGKDLVPVMPPGARFRNMLMPPRDPPRQQDGVRIRQKDSFLVRAGKFTLSATKGAKDGKWSLNVAADKSDLLTPEQDAAFTARWRLTHDGNFAKSFKLTDEQIKQLGEVPGKGGLVADESDKERLRGLLEAFAAAPAPKQNEEKALVAALAEIGPKCVEATRKSLLERVDRINSILTPEQIAQFKEQAPR